MTAARSDAPRATMSVPEAAQVLGVGRDAAYRAVARGEIPHLRVGRRILVPVAALERMLDIDHQPVAGGHAHGRADGDEPRPDEY
jgi:excisionase family DNA binding protein